MTTKPATAFDIEAEARKAFEGHQLTEPVKAKIRAFARRAQLAAYRDAAAQYCDLCRKGTPFRAGDTSFEYHANGAPSSMTWCEATKINLRIAELKLEEP